MKKKYFVISLVITGLLLIVEIATIILLEYPVISLPVYDGENTYYIGIGIFMCELCSLCNRPSPTSSSSSPIKEFKFNPISIIICFGIILLIVLAFAKIINKIKAKKSY